MLTFYQYLAFLLPTFYLLLKGYFLSIEFTLYPYLTSAGLLPYKNIVDQHFPSLFFGFFSLPYYLVDKPEKLLILLILLNTGTAYFLYLFLKNEKVQNSQWWLFMFSLLQIYFSANYLWTETFVCFFLSLVLHSNRYSNKAIGLLSGLVLFQVVLIRPTSIIFVFLYYLFYIRNKIYVFLGGFVSFILSISYLLYYQLLPNFVQLAIEFNKHVYSQHQSPTPGKRQIISLIALVAVFCYLLIKKKKYFFLIAGISTLALIYPRFGFEHLQLFGLSFVYFLSQIKINSKEYYLIFTTVTILFLQSILGITRARYGNYFHSPELYHQASQLRHLVQKEVYLLGASDLLYPLSEKLPPNKYYLPSLPWYLNQPDFVKQLITNLQSSKALVLLDPNFTVDDQKLITSSPEIYTYIKMNYILDGQIGSLELYKPKL